MTTDKKLDLVGFARWIATEHFESDLMGVEIDGGTFQEKATEFGVLVVHRPERPCSDGYSGEPSCSCADAGAEFPTDCYRLHDDLMEEV